MPSRFSRRGQSAMNVPREWNLHLAPDRLQESRAGAAHPVWKVPEQQWKLTLSLEGNLKCENTHVHGGKWCVITLTLHSADWDSLHSSPASQEEQPLARKPTAWCSRGEGMHLKFLCPELLEHSTQVHDFISGWKDPALFPARHCKSLILWDLNPCMNEMQPWALCPTPACQDQLVTFRYSQKKNTDHELRSWACSLLAKDFSYHICTQNFNPPGTNKPLKFTTEICTGTQKHHAATTPHIRSAVCTRHMCWHSTNRDGKQGAIL